MITTLSPFLCRKMITSQESLELSQPTRYRCSKISFRNKRKMAFWTLQSSRKIYKSKRTKTSWCRSLLKFSRCSLATLWKRKLPLILKSLLIWLLMLRISYLTWFKRKIMSKKSKFKVLPKKLEAWNWASNSLQSLQENQILNRWTRWKKVRPLLGQSMQTEPLKGQYEYKERRQQTCTLSQSVSSKTIQKHLKTSSATLSKYWLTPMISKHSDLTIGVIFLTSAARSFKWFPKR